MKEGENDRRMIIERRTGSLEKNINKWINKESLLLTAIYRRLHFFLI